MRTEQPDVEKMLESLDPETDAARNAVHLRAIMRAVETRDAADAAVTAAVESARAAGDPWTAVAAALGVTAADAETTYRPVIDSRLRLIDEALERSASTDR